MGYIPTNPVAAVDVLKDKAEARRSGHEPFTADEVSRLAAVASGDWQGAILLGATSGLRLRDVANLTWGAIDFVEGLLRTETEKTGTVVVLPVHPDFMACLLTGHAASERPSCSPHWQASTLAVAAGCPHSFARSLSRRE
jgi:integrase